MTYSVTIGNEQLPVLIRKRRGARRFTIRYQPLSHAVSLTLPAYASIRQGLRFIEAKQGWIARQMRRKPQPVPFCNGQVIPVLGKHYALKHIGGRGVVRLEDESILVPGNPEFMARRVREWLKARAREEIAMLAERKAEKIGARVKKISLRDTSSRWGSCSRDGHLSFSWRLVLAPYEVLEYLVSHEVAHLRELNHSRAFWALVAQLFPAYEQAQQWLRRHGEGLYAYG